MTATGVDELTSSPCVCLFVHLNLCFIPSSTQFRKYDEGTGDVKKEESM